jgi:exopolysaccharide production protein ExoQ
VTAGIAAVVFAFGILGLFWFDRDLDSRTSKALWIPVAWTLIAASRPVSAWLHMSPPTGQPAVYLEGSPIDRFVFTALLALGSWILITRGRQVVTLLWTNGPILLFFVYCAMSSLWSDYPDVAFKRWLKALGDLVMVLIVLTDQNPVAAIKRFLTRLSFPLLPLSVLLIKYYPDLGRGYNRWTWSTFYMGVGTDKNSLGLLCLVCGLGALWQFLDAFQAKETPHRSRHLIAQGTLVVMVLWLLRMADSVTSTACFLMGSVLILATRLFASARKMAVVHALMLSMVVASIFAIFLDPSSGLIESMGRNPTLTGRTDIWAHVIPLNPNPWIGSGYESFWLGERLQKMWSAYWWHPNEAHNGYLEVYLNLGWIGVVLLAALIFTGYRNGCAEFRLEPEIGSLKLSYFIAAVAYSFSEAGFRELSPIWIFFLLMTVAVPISSAVPETEAESEDEFDFTDERADSVAPIGTTLSFQLPQKT